MTALRGVPPMARFAARMWLPVAAGRARPAFVVGPEEDALQSESGTTRSKGLSVALGSVSLSTLTRRCDTIDEMSTTWTLSCTNGGRETIIEVTDAISVGVAGSWKALTPADCDVPGGAIGNFKEPTLFLASSTGTPHQISGFAKKTVRDDTGKGIKSSLDGNFPEGEFVGVVPHSVTCLKSIMEADG